jgi:hypothetical protein
VEQPFVNEIYVKFATVRGAFDLLEDYNTINTSIEVSSVQKIHDICHKNIC